MTDNLHALLTKHNFLLNIKIRDISNKKVEPLKIETEVNGSKYAVSRMTLSEDDFFNIFKDEVIENSDLMFLKTFQVNHSETGDVYSMFLFSASKSNFKLSGNYDFEEVVLNEDFISEYKGDVK